jgi:hypothetical protein
MDDLEALAAATGGSSAEPREWSVYWMGQNYGPYTLTELRQYATSGQFPTTAQVMRPGMQAWTPISTVMAGFAQPAPAWSPEPVGYATPEYEPSPYTPYRKPPKGFFARWKFKAGGRSFMLQMICLGWTALLGGMIVAQTIGVVGRKPKPYERSYYDEDVENTAKAGALLVSWTCLASAWGLVVLPCGIAAIATYEGGRRRY